MERIHLVDPWDPTGWPDPVPFEGLGLSNTQDIFTVVDSEDIAEIRAQGLWSIYEYRTKSYARKSITRADGSRTSMYLHRFIAENFMDPPMDPGQYLVDHKNGDGLDNRKVNLRWVTPKENSDNINGLWWKQETKDRWVSYHEIQRSRKKWMHLKKRQLSGRSY